VLKGSLGWSISRHDGETKGGGGCLNSRISGSGEGKKYESDPIITPVNSDRRGSVTLLGAVRGGRRPARSRDRKGGLTSGLLTYDGGRRRGGDVIH